MFAIMTKVGVYALLRLGMLLFGAEAGASADFGRMWLFAMGCLTMVAGIAGVLAVRDLGRLGGYNLVVSAGTLIAAVAFDHPAVTAGAILYLVVSTLGATTLFLLAGVIAGERGDAFDEVERLEAYDPAGDGLYTEEDERAVLIAAPVGVLSGAFLVVTLMVAGIPPLPGFLAKVAILAPLMGQLGTWPGVVMVVLLIASSLFVLVALMRAGIQIWWVESARVPPVIRLAEIAPMVVLLTLCVALTVFVQTPFGFIKRAADQLHDPSNYVRAVLGEEGRR
jgi:multicomponent K+:H+ antiporter subunit D